MHLVYQDLLDTMEKHSTVQKYPNEIEDILECALDELKELDKSEFEHLLIKLHKIVYGGKFSELLARHAVKHMKNKDPKHLHGEFWSDHDVAEIAKEYGILTHNTDPWGTYFVLNMMRSDYYNPELPDDEEKYYATLAKDWLTDVDTGENKTFCYWAYIVKGY